MQVPCEKATIAAAPGSYVRGLLMAYRASLARALCAALAMVACAASHGRAGVADEGDTYPHRRVTRPGRAARPRRAPSLHDSLFGLPCSLFSVAVAAPTQGPQEIILRPRNSH